MNLPEQLTGALVSALDEFLGGLPPEDRAEFLHRHATAETRAALRRVQRLSQEACRTGRRSTYCVSDNPTANQIHLLNHLIELDRLLRLPTANVLRAAATATRGGAEMPQFPN